MTVMKDLSRALFNAADQSLIFIHTGAVANHTMVAASMVHCMVSSGMTLNMKRAGGTIVATRASRPKILAKDFMGWLGQAVAGFGPKALEKTIYRRPQAMAHGRGRNETNTP